MKKIKNFIVAGLLLAMSSLSFAQSSKSLVVYFSRTDENYSVGYIKEGNTAILAKMIAEKTGSDIFEIKPVTPYPAAYRACTDVAKKEQNEKARPAIVGQVSNIADYDTIYLGYPIWWGDFPMCVYTFFDSHSIDGKTIIPFCTHEGSGSSGTDRNLKNLFKNSEVKEILSMRGKTAQSDRKSAESSIDSWLKKVGNN